MSQGDLNSLFARAEQAFVKGKLDEAGRMLGDLTRAVGDHPAVLHLQALVQKKGGLYEEARRAFRKALTLAPKDPQINSNFANLLDDCGEVEAALEHYGRALSATPEFHDARYNRALLLHKLGRHQEALAELDIVAAARPPDGKVHSARGAILRSLHRLKEAAVAYDAALAIDPRRMVALHGRARIAMERGEECASDLYRRAVSLCPADLDLQLGLAEALEAEGKPGAVETLAAVVAAHPQWGVGQAVLARMRWEAGEDHRFARDFVRALEQAPHSRQLWAAYASTLGAADLFIEAADAAARAQSLVPDDGSLRLLEAGYSSEGGDLDRADRLFASLPSALPGWCIHATRHAIRRNEIDRGLDLAERALVEDPWGIAAWALAGLLWRITGDPRAQWLHEQPGLIATSYIDLSEQQLRAAADRVRSLHRARIHPIGQSLRGGTQTRGRLFERQESEVVLLREAIIRAVRSYWEALPPADPDHPLLRHRDAQLRFAGAWSVRLMQGGFHVSHIHPHGIVSSACYLAVPQTQAPEEGWLEIGKPPEELGVALEPLFKVHPAPGKLALFPSTLFHGTRPFAGGERLTVAFDLAGQ